MSKGKQVHCYQYVNQPYERVQAALQEGPRELFQRATRVATSRAQDVTASLRVDFSGFEIGADIIITIDSIEEDKEAPPPFSPITRIQLSWAAQNAPRWFPVMKAELSIYPLTHKETQLDFSGTYLPPMGFVGQAINALVGHRIAEASVQQFLADVALRLATELALPQHAEQAHAPA